MMHGSYNIKLINENILEITDVNSRSFICEITQQSSQVETEETFAYRCQIYMTGSLAIRNGASLILYSSTS